jgi:hypothetical protein
MDKELDKIVAATILDKIGPDIKPINYLADTLNIGRESAYRRLTGNMSFSFPEIVELSLKLGFSIDDIIGQGDEKRVFFDLQGSESYTTQKSFHAMLKEYLKYIRRVSEMTNVSSISTMNRVFTVFTIGYENLFKFYYYKWMHQMDNVPLNFYFSEIELPADIMHLYDKINDCMQFSGSRTFLFDQYVYLNVIEDICYYYNRNLITQEEALLLKDDLNLLINDTEEKARLGKNDLGFPYQYYISTVNIDSNISCVTAENGNFTFFRMYSVNPVIIENNEVYAMAKKLIDSLKKYCILITQSNEMLLSDFFNKQREYLEKIQ